MNPFFLRAAGALLLFASCFLFGVSCETRLKRRWMILREFLEFFRYLERETSRRRTPLWEAMELGANRCRTEVREVLLFAAEQIRERKGGEFVRIWETAVFEKLGRDLTGEEAFQAILQSAGALCGSDLVLQRELLSQCADRFALLEEDARKDYRSRGTLFRRLGAAAGIFLILIFL